jgi:hypothetical protein
MTIQLETDYLIIGSGAVGMAFADILLSETNYTITIVDKHHRPGGHWNDAYSFVTLHQPSAFYGVSSLELSSGTISKIGPNEGLQELATGNEVMAYFDQVMRNTFLPSGRVQYFPMCEYTGDANFKSILSDKSYEVKVNKKVVDATFFNTSVPSTHKVNFEVDPSMELIPLNDLPSLKNARSNYVVVGGGKTGIDACMWLLENNINPDDIRWIMPRDAWLFDRKNTQSSMDFFDHSIGNQARQLQALAEAESIEDLFERLESAGSLIRIDRSVKPKMFHGATISIKEIEQLRRIKNVIRLGRVTRIQKDKIILQEGTIPTNQSTVHIDCSASAVPPRPPKLVFKDDLITVQTVRTVQPVFSAAFIAHIEATYPDDTEQQIAKKNKLCSLVPLPNHDTDWIFTTGAQMMNQFTWSQEPGLREWVANNRLDGFSSIISSVEKTDTDKQRILAKFKQFAAPAMNNIQRFIVELEANSDNAKQTNW